MNHLNVLYTCSENYLPYAGVSICSLLENNREIDLITIYVVYDNVTSDSLNKLQDQVSRYGKMREIHLINGQKYIKKMKDLEMNGYRKSYAPNLRLFFHEYIDKNVERLLYLDCDTIILGCLLPLLTINLGDKCAAVVHESIIGNNKHYIGFNKKDPYFNAGSLLIDMMNWFKNQRDQAVIEYLNKPTMKHANGDQDYLNIILKDKIYILPPEYNLQPFHLVYSDKVYFSCYPNEEYYSCVELENARKYPKIIHAYRFLGQFPWYQNNLHPSKDLFNEYLNKSEWSGIDKKPNRSWVFAVERVLFMILPRKVFLKLFVLFQKVYFRYKEKNARRK